jgi:hypothetical protein
MQTHTLVRPDPAAVSTLPRALAVLTSRPEPPTWVSRWCERSGLELRTHRIPGSTPPWPDLGLLQRLDRLAEHMVYLDRPSTAQGESLVIAAIGSLPEDEGVLDAAIQSAAQLDARLEIVHAMPVSFGERSVGLPQALEHAQALLRAATGRARDRPPRRPVGQRLVRSHAQELVGQPLHAQLLVIGRPTQLVGTGHGLVTASAVTGGTCPLLLVSAPLGTWGHGGRD